MNKGSLETGRLLSLSGQQERRGCAAIQGIGVKKKKGNLHARLCFFGESAKTFKLKMPGRGESKGRDAKSAANGEGGKQRWVDFFFVRM